MFDFLFGPGRDENHASDIISHLKEVFGAREGFITNQPHHTQLRLTMAVVDIKITCRNSKIYIALQGHSDNNFEDHLPIQVECVKAKIRSYLSGSYAAKWRDRVVGI